MFFIFAVDDVDASNVSWLTMLFMMVKSPLRKTLNKVIKNLVYGWLNIHHYVCLCCYKSENCWKYYSLHCVDNFEPYISFVTLKLVNLKFGVCLYVMRKWYLIGSYYFLSLMHALKTISLYQRFKNAAIFFKSTGLSSFGKYWCFLCWRFLCKIYFFL